ncbi:ATP-binding cassette domain-containing protein [Thermococcus peptonophilus]|uniref:ATP-binding cassette domain-containing protein n=1 Tax=Thermococcus peptonophilus TaxID=53952 RepID=UPI0006D19D06
MKVKVDNLVKVYGDVIALKNVTLSFKAGNIYVLLGPNGAGKTTLVKIISGLIPPTSGDVYVNGLSVTENPPSSARNMLRFVPPQEPALDWLLSVYDNLYYYAWLLGLPKAERKRAVERVLKKFNLSDYSNFAINQLSGGAFKGGFRLLERS